MVKMYNTNIETNETEEVYEFKKGNWINMIAPTEEEIEIVCKKLKIKEDFIRYSLDYEEKARIDTEDDDNTILFIIDVPIIEKESINFNIAFYGNRYDQEKKKERELRTKTLIP